MIIRTDGNASRFGGARKVELLDVLGITSRLERKDIDRRRVGGEHVEEAASPELARHPRQQSAPSTYSLSPMVAMSLSIVAEPSVCLYCFSRTLVS